MLKTKLHSDCHTLQRKIPELSANEKNMVCQILEGHCNECVETVNNVLIHLEGAVDDWERFIKDNCSEGECERIFESLNQTRSRLGQHVKEDEERINTTEIKCDDSKRSVTHLEPKPETTVSQTETQE